MAYKTIELRQLTVEQKWKTAEGNLIYFVVSGIAYAKSLGKTPEDFGCFAGLVAAPSWASDRGKGPRALVEGISENKQQFRDFQLQVLSESETMVKARMKGYGEDDVRDRPQHEITADEYRRFFEKKWVAIADYLGLEYTQQIEGEWTVFTIRENK